MIQLSFLSLCDWGYSGTTNDDEDNGKRSRLERKVLV